MSDGRSFTPHEYVARPEFESRMEHFERRLEYQFGDVKTQFRTLNVKLDRVLEDHEARIRKLESWGSRLAGKWTILGLIGAVLLSSLVSWGMSHLLVLSGGR